MRHLELHPPRSQQEMEDNLQTIAEVTLDNEGIALLEVWMASRTAPDLRRVFSRLEAENERTRYKEIREVFGNKAVDTSDLYLLMEGFILIVRGLALQHIFHDAAAESEVWVYWRRKLAAELFACIDDNGVVAA